MKHPVTIKGTITGQITDHHNNVLELEINNDFWIRRSAYKNVLQGKEVGDTVSYKCEFESMNLDNKEDISALFILYAIKEL